MQFKIERYAVFVRFFPDFEYITAGIKQVEPLAAVGDAEAALLGGRTHDNWIAGCEMQRIAVEGQINENIAPHMGRYAIFERILHEG